MVLKLRGRLAGIDSLMSFRRGYLCTADGRKIARPDFFEVETYYGEPYNKHHLLFCKKNWKGGYSEGLRGLSYCQMKIPEFSLHREIHQTMPDGIIPPDGQTCKRAINDLEYLMDLGYIDCCRDRLTYRLAILITEFEGEAPATVRGLWNQLRIAANYYA